MLVVKPELITDSTFLEKPSAAFRFNSLVDMFCVDHLRMKDRFEINYVLLSSF